MAWAVARAKRPYWRKAGLAATATVINLALVGLLSITALGVATDGTTPQPPLVYLDIEPRPLLADERPREPVFAPSRAEAADSRSPSDAAATVRRPDPAYEGRPSPIQPRIAVQPPAGAPPPEDVWRVSPTERRGAMARSLRQSAVGCASPELLNDAERRHCREQFGERAATAAPITGSGNPERDAAFAREGARRLAQWEAQRRPLRGGVGVVGPADCVGSNFGTGCAGAHLGTVPGVDMRQGSDSLVRQDSNKVD